MIILIFILFWVGARGGRTFARDNATYHNNDDKDISAQRRGVVDDSIYLSINIFETHFFHIMSSSRTFWCAYQLLLITLKLKFMKSENQLEHTYMIFWHQPRNPQKSNLQQKPTMAPKHDHDMFRYGFIHCDMSLFRICLYFLGFWGPPSYAKPTKKTWSRMWRFG